MERVVGGRRAGPGSLREDTCRTWTARSRSFHWRDPLRKGPRVLSKNEPAGDADRDDGANPGTIWTCARRSDGERRGCDWFYVRRDS